MSKYHLLIFLTAFTIAGAGIKLKKEEATNIINQSRNYTTTSEVDFEIAAHRGFSSLEVENSKDAIKEAASKEYIDYIEIDARLTKDGKIILSHNDNPTPFPYRPKISEQDYNQVLETNHYYCNNILRNALTEGINSEERTSIIMKNFNLFLKKYRLIGLVEGINSCQDKKILLDLKFSDNQEAFTEELQKELEGIDTSNIIFQSIDIPGILYLQEHTDYNCLAIIDKEEDLDYIPLFQNVGIRKNLIDHDLIEELLAEDKIVAVWTINTTQELNTTVEELDNLYKDIIYITNYPDTMTKRLLEIEKQKIKKGD